MKSSLKEIDSKIEQILEMIKIDSKINYIIK